MKPKVCQPGPNRFSSSHDELQADAIDRPCSKRLLILEGGRNRSRRGDAERLKAVVTCARAFQRQRPLPALLPAIHDMDVIVTVASNTV